MKDFDINFKKIRDELGMTQSEMSEKIGLSLRQYQRYEKNSANLTFSKISEFADKLNISIDELINSSNLSSVATSNERNFIKMKEIDRILGKMKELTDVKTDVELAEILEIPIKTLSMWRFRESIPAKRLIEFADKLNISVDELKNGNTTESNDTFSIKKITSYFASAGGGNEINDIEVYDTDEVLQIDKAFFKLPPSKNARAIRVDGYSMVPMLLPDSWVIFEEQSEFKGDGLYVINYSGQLMVKLLQLTPKGILRVISKNEDFESYEIKVNENNQYFHIVGKVIKSIV